MNSTILTTGEIDLFAPDFLSDVDREKDEDVLISEEAVRFGLEVVSLKPSFQGCRTIVVRGTQAAIDTWRDNVGWGDADGFPFEVKADGRYDVKS